MDTLQKSERWAIGSLLIAALLTFFLPLVTIQLPILGNQDVSGYDLVTRAKQLTHALNGAKSTDLGKARPELDESAPRIPNRAVTHPMPFIVQALSYVPAEILASFACVLVVLLSCLTSIKVVIAKLCASLGAVLAILTIVHLTVANSALHEWFRAQFETDSGTLSNNPFAGMARELGHLAAQSLQIRPGVGLYVLTVCLGLSAVLLNVRILARAQSSAKPSLSPQDQES